MLAPRASTAFVCFRCELQLARRRGPSLARSSHATFSASARCRNGSQELDATAHEPEKGLRILREREPHNRTRRRKGKLIRETSARLGDLKQLGGDAEILLIREVAEDIPKKTEDQEEEIETIEKPEVPDILDTITQQNKTLTPEEVRDRLEGLRPANHGDPNEPHYVTQKTFVKTIRDLMRGFTQSQLSQFYSAAKNLQEKEIHREVLASLKKEKGEERPSIRTNWQPGLTPSSRRLPGAEIPIRSKRAPVSKQLLVDRIMRDVWELVPLEEVEAAGELELSLKPWQSALLNAGDHETPLDKISNARNVKIELHQEHSVIRITADKNTAEYAADDIDKVLDGAISRKLQLKPWIKSLEPDKVPQNHKLATLFTKEDFDMITSLTHASIQRMDNTNTLVIRGTDQRAVTEAERLLLRLLPLKDPVHCTIDAHELHSEQSSCHQLSVTYDEQALDYKFRNARLGRWVSSVSRLGSSRTSEEQERPDQTGTANSKSAANKRSVTRVVRSLCHSVQEHTSPSAKASEHKGVGDWSPTPEYKLFAKFGHAMFPFQDQAIQNEAKSNKLATPQPVWSRSIPGLASLMMSSFLQGATPAKPKPCIKAFTRTQAPSLLYDFTPAPEQHGFEADQLFPALRIQMRTSPTGGDAVLHRVSLHVQEHVHDVLLPSQASDIQFSSHGSLRLQKSHHDKNVHQWVKAVCENIASGERLTAPSLTIDIPKWIIPGSPANATGLRSVNYLFSGIHFRQTVIGSFMDTPVSYNTTQSGKMGPRGGALTMAYDSIGQSRETLLQDEEGLKSFVKKCFVMTDHITEAATQTQPTFKMLRPRSDGSGRKSRRSVQQTMEPFEEASEVAESSEDSHDPLLGSDAETTKIPEPSSIHQAAATDLADAQTASVPSSSDSESTSPPPSSSERRSSEAANIDDVHVVKSTA
ncbi:mitochondrial inner-membrane-bound regulator-domain-containing protein [Paraphoma chrysanthemicola]|uniref:Mitochondrial inner-membrane-bound regulator-domain-containing protein n=1 Tax=Paraphoma chrysanthemicola TaxID=798071 RepID=A0A8K0R155_9PLEO|nr:mitochondrial inner-membrane-bound regulator-domain-containing protein [Paraphoma chrysanthemicola]